jgi:2-polyprenyl-3-methyl-5-hydroxy-6-metoxy-1,4-benzoquinol methylase
MRTSMRLAKTYCQSFRWHSFRLRSLPERETFPAFEPAGGPPVQSVESAGKVVYSVPVAAADRESLKRIFDQDAELYDRARPGYPERLFDDLFALAALERGAAVLEIGCGTGQATRELARRGCRIVCVELGKRLAAVARRNLAHFPQVDVVTSAFETWAPHGAVFDMA